MIKYKYKAKGVEMSVKAPALTEGLKILEILAGSDGPVPFQQLDAVSGMSRASVTRLLKVLSEAGYVESGRSFGSGYTPGVKFLYLLNAANDKVDRLRFISKRLDGVADDFNCSIQYAVFDRVNPAITVVCKAQSESAPALVKVGSDLVPCSHRHALGRIIMALATPDEKTRIIEKNLPSKNTQYTIMPGTKLDAELDNIRKAGIAFEDQECQLGINRVAVPVFDAGNKIAGGVCASWFDMEFSEETALRIAEKLKETAGFINTIS